MGYRRELTATDIFPNSPPEQGAQKPFERVVKRRRNLVTLPSKFVANVTAAAGKRAATNPSSAIGADQFAALQFRSTGFGDSVFVEKALTGEMSVVALANVVLYGAMAMITNLAERSPIRGGIDIAYGVSLEGTLYSAASVRAYELERCAKYPRLLLGDQYLKFVEHHVIRRPQQRHWRE